jgi:hypothetical protein
MIECVKYLVGISFLVNYHDPLQILEALIIIKKIVIPDGVLLKIKLVS